MMQTFLDEARAREATRVRDSARFEVRWYSIASGLEVLAIIWLLSRGALLGALAVSGIFSACVHVVRRAKRRLKELS